MDTFGDSTASETLAADLARAIADVAASDTDMQHFIDYACCVAVPQLGATANLGEIVVRMGRIAASAGAQESDAGHVLLAKLQAYFAARPPHPRLMQVFKDWLRHAVQSGQSNAAGQAFARWAGASRNVASTPPAQGGVRGGALLQAQLAQAAKKPAR